MGFSFRVNGMGWGFYVPLDSRLRGNDGCKAAAPHPLILNLLKDGNVGGRRRVGPE